MDRLVGGTKASPTLVPLDTKEELLSWAEKIKPHVPYCIMVRDVDCPPREGHREASPLEGVVIQEFYQGGKSFVTVEKCPVFQVGTWGCQ